MILDLYINSTNDQQSTTGCFLRNADTSMCLTLYFIMSLRGLTWSLHITDSSFAALDLIIMFKCQPWNT